MKKKEAKRLKKAVISAVENWYPNLGLGPYQREVNFIHSAKSFRQEHGRMVAMRVWCDWRYQDLYIEVCLPALKGMTEARIEGLVVHELVHALVNPLSSDKRKDHEEFVVTNLTNAFIWVRNAARKGKS